MRVFTSSEKLDTFNRRFGIVVFVELDQWFVYVVVAEQLHRLLAFFANDGID